MQLVGSVLTLRDDEDLGRTSRRRIEAVGNDLELSDGVSAELRLTVLWVSRVLCDLLAV